MNPHHSTKTPTVQLPFSADALEIEDDTVELAIRADARGDWQCYRTLPARCHWQRPMTMWEKWRTTVIGVSLLTLGVIGLSFL